jgi:hypothetical protein
VRPLSAILGLRWSIPVFGEIMIAGRRDIDRRRSRRGGGGRGVALIRRWLSRLSTQSILSSPRGSTTALKAMNGRSMRVSKMMRKISAGERTNAECADMFERRLKRQEVLEREDETAVGDSLNEDVRWAEIDNSVIRSGLSKAGLCQGGDTDNWLDADCTKVEVWLRLYLTSPLPSNIFVHQTSCRRSSAAKTNAIPWGLSFSFTQIMTCYHSASRSRSVHLDYLARTLRRGAAQMLDSEHLDGMGSSG